MQAPKSVPNTQIPAHNRLHSCFWAFHIIFLPLVEPGTHMVNTNSAKALTHMKEK